MVLGFASCSAPNVCSLSTCLGCCDADGVCGPCDGGTSGGAAAGGSTAGGEGGGTGGATAGGQGGGTAGGQSGGTAGGAAGGGTGGGGAVACTTPGAFCNPGGDAGFTGMCCGGVCRPYDRDPLNCGSCGAQCPSGATCSQARCSQACTGASCPSGTQCTTDPVGPRMACFPTSCAGIGNANQCARGASTTGRCCGGGCVDTLNDRAHCGYCGHGCGAGQICLSGTCTAPVNCATSLADTSCLLDAGVVGRCCGGACGSPNYQTDPENCGGCGQRCPVGNLCSAGQCRAGDGGTGFCTSTTVCPTGTSCSSVLQKCVTDTCGPADQASPCSGPPTSNGASRACCGSTCTDLNADSNNCSACGHHCSAGTFCNNGVCRASPTCTVSNSGADCPAPGGGVGQCCGTACVNRGTDTQNCGACGASCAAGHVCRNGNCTWPDGGFGSCLTGVGCPSGTVCENNKCLPLTCAPGSSGAACGFGRGVGASQYFTTTGTCCNGACVDFKQDPQNCAACGASCTSGLCVTGSVSGGPGGSSCLEQPASTCPLSCPPDMFCTTGGCKSRSCSFSGGSCLSSSGQTGTCCSQGFSNTCVNPLNDVDNCGGCGISCGPGATCTAGVCSNLLPPCKPGHLGQFCDLDAGLNHLCCPGGCIDVLDDANNCGRCGNRCAAGLSCVNGGCVALTCTAALQSQPCRGDAGVLGNCCSSACSDRLTDPSNCGQCGRQCVGAETCAGGGCGLDTCTPSTQGSSCHRDAGIEYYLQVGSCCGSACLDLRTDRGNCGNCGRVCPGTTNCVNGNCQ
ncbi:MAG: hypothetical protein IPJ65_31585 [Archangiaceae bacterium]|nr:hypothetical protein [Archangiaceae bacterium]